MALPRSDSEKTARVGRQIPDRLRRRVHRHARGDRLEVVDRALVDERGDRHVADERVAVEHPQAPRGGDLADRGRVDEPLLAHRHDLVDLVGLDDAQHPLLRLRDHDLEGLHVGLAQRDLADVEVQADLALARHLRARRGQAGRAEVLQRDEQPALEQLERALEQLLLLERVADLDGRALGGVELVELRARQHRRAADPVAARARAEQQHDVADARGRRADQVVLLDQPEAHRVDEAVGLVGVLEVDLAADGRDADRVAVVADAGHRLLEQVARARRARDLAEAQRVEDRDRPRADREHVAQDAADAGGGALERLDRARVVVRLDLERAREPAAERDRAGVLPRAHHHAAALDRQRAQQPLGVLVGAVLRPHQREDRELDLVRLALHVLDDELVLAVGETELAVAGGGHGHASAGTTDSNSFNPSTEPVSGSTACSGCGISPTTLPAALETPAMSRSEPLGFSPGA